MPKTITTASALSTKASKALDLMRARAVKADEARTAAAHHARAAQVADAATDAATANRARGRGMGHGGDPCRHTRRPVPPRGRAGRPRTRHRWARARRVIQGCAALGPGACRRLAGPRAARRAAGRGRRGRQRLPHPRGSRPRRPHPISASDSTNRTRSACRERECFW